nr:YfhO family protein [Solobacterium sp.]
FTIRCRKPLFGPVMVGLVLIGAVYQTVFVFSPYGGNYLFYFQDESLVEQSLGEYSSRAALDAEDGFYRVEMEENRTNVDGYLGINGTRLWWSVIPSSTTEYYMDLALDTVRYNCDIYGLDTRTGLLELAGARYYTRPAAEDGIIPYGYDETASTDPKYQMFRNRYALPVGYTYSGYISKEEYDQLNGIEKEQALLQAAVLEEKNLPLPEAVIEQPMEQLAFELVSSDHAEWSGNELISTTQGGQIALAVDVPEDCELYLYLKNIHLQGESTNVKLIAARSVDGLLLTEKTALITTEAFFWPVIRDDTAFNLGYGHKGLNTITLTISEEARFSIDDIEIYAVPMSSYEKYVEKLGEYVLEDAVVGEDQVKGQIFVPEPRILQFAIPYSIGWKAYVDGTETEVLRSGGMYMAVLLDAGEHSVELRYATPYLKTGSAISLAVLLCLAGSAFLKKKNSRS